MTIFEIIIVTAIAAVVLYVSFYFAFRAYVSRYAKFVKALTGQSPFSSSLGRTSPKLIELKETSDYFGVLKFKAYSETGYYTVIFNKNLFSIDVTVTNDFNVKESRTFNFEGSLGDADAPVTLYKTIFSLIEQMEKETK